MFGKIESFIFGVVATIAVIEGAIIYVKVETEAEWRYRPFRYKTNNEKHDGRMEPENHHIGFV